MSNWQYSVRREDLFETLGLPSKIPPDFSHTFDNVVIPNVPGEWDSGKEFIGLI